MAEILDRFPRRFVNRARGKPPKYQEEWFDGRARRLNYYVDLSGYASIASARTSLYKQAVSRNLKALIAVEGDFLYFQVVNESVTP